MNARWTGTAVAALLACACRSERPAANRGEVAGRLTGDWSTAHAARRVAYGKRWSLGGDVAVSASGRFAVPSNARVVVAYVDSNANGHFDRYAEPSGDCLHADSTWSCEIPLSRATLQRAMSSHNGEHRDQTLVFWEDFTKDGDRVEPSSVCVANRCTRLEPSPFVASSPTELRMLSICGEEGFAPQDAAVTSPNRSGTLHIARPAELHVSVRNSERRGGGLRFNLESPRVDRLLVWAGKLDPKSGVVEQVYWSSENDDVEIVDSAAGFDVSVPARLLQACEGSPACEIVVQAVKYWDHDKDVVSATEYRTTVSFRGQP